MLTTGGIGNNVDDNDIDNKVDDNDQNEKLKRILILLDNSLD